ncbi:hypothetical protein [Paeniglutamicibacter kerguelensis]|uniref:Uncharacterized protein n=1 Tax=Paeniglutamicibacter kerguelensis TaxID=254788 RepID=A0ABS4XDB9_9MICC|nr:hypothetical protein [Paeniglutamicibacter kerguelensis]MBP2385659.1 hypothetical protein [Paeniglutamicibacter kerguelensis]
MADQTDNDSSKFRSRLGGAAALGLASGLLTLIDPAKLRPATRAGLCFGTGAVTGAAAWFGSVREEPLETTKVFRGALALGLAMLGVGSTKLGFVLDAKIHQALLRRGISNPRPIMAVGSGILTTVTFLLDGPREGTGPSPRPGSAEEELPIRDLPQPVRELIEGILGETDEFGSGILREQLGEAREQYWGNPWEFAYQLDLAVPADTARTVPRDYTFPVHANFTTPEGHPVRVSLLVNDGQLGALTVDIDHEAMEPVQGDAADPLGSFARWPLASEVTYSLEG